MEKIVATKIWGQRSLLQQCAHRVAIMKIDLQPSGHERWSNVQFSNKISTQQCFPLRGKHCCVEFCCWIQTLLYSLKWTHWTLLSRTKVFQSIETSSQTYFKFILIQSVHSDLLITIASNFFLNILKYSLSKRSNHFWVEQPVCIYHISTIVGSRRPGCRKLHGILARHSLLQYILAPVSQQFPTSG